MRYLFLLGLVMYTFFISGCGTTTEEGGSSLPWSRPESWENQALPSMEEQ